MSLINVISALGNNSSIYPLLVRDCAIENLAKCAMTYKQNAKESKFIARQATRERIIDEYGTSIVWLGGIPLMERLADKWIKKKGFAPEFNLKLFKETDAQGINLNIEKFKNTAPDAIQDLEKIKNNKKAFQNLQIGKFAASTIIPILVMGFLLPKLNFLYTKKKIKEAQNTPCEGKISFTKNIQNKTTSMDEFIKTTQKRVQEKKNNTINFLGVEQLANMSKLQKMMILDGGLTVGRVKTGRNWAEKLELGFKMAMMCYLNYRAPKKIEKLLNTLTKTIFGINTQLDVKVLNDKDFIKQIKDKTLLLPQNNSEKAIIDFIDTNPDSTFVKQLENLNMVSFIKKGVRDPRRYVETDKIAQFTDAVKEFSKDALNSDSVENFAKKALKAKSFNIIANVALSSFLLAVMLPKIQFIFRKIITGSNIDPGLKEYTQNDKQNKEKKIA